MQKSNRLCLNPSNQRRAHGHTGTFLLINSALVQGCRASVHPTATIVCTAPAPPLQQLCLLQRWAGPAVHRYLWEKMCQLDIYLTKTRSMDIHGTNQNNYLKYLQGENNTRISIEVISCFGIYTNKNKLRLYVSFCL